MLINKYKLTAKKCEIKIDPAINIKEHDVEIPCNILQTPDSIYFNINPV